LADKRGGFGFTDVRDQGSDRGSGVNRFDRLSCDSDVMINAARSELLVRIANCDDIGFGITYDI
jgi:hypothetical protein